MPHFDTITLFQQSVVLHFLTLERGDMICIISMFYENTDVVIMIMPECVSEFENRHLMLLVNK